MVSGRAHQALMSFPVLDRHLSACGYDHYCQIASGARKDDLGNCIVAVSFESWCGTCL